MASLDVLGGLCPRLVRTSCIISRNRTLLIVIIPERIPAARGNRLGGRRCVTTYNDITRPFGEDPLPCESEWIFPVLTPSIRGGCYKLSLNVDPNRIAGGKGHENAGVHRRPPRCYVVGLHHCPGEHRCPAGTRRLLAVRRDPASLLEQVDELGHRRHDERIVCGSAELERRPDGVTTRTSRISYPDIIRVPGVREDDLSR